MTEVLSLETLQNYTYTQMKDLVTKSGLSLSKAKIIGAYVEIGARLRFRFTRGYTPVWV